MAASKDTIPTESVESKAVMERYSALIHNLREAIARDYPERAGNIYIVDPTQPLDQELVRAEQHLQMDRMRERIVHDAGPEVLTPQGVANTGGLTIAMRRGDTNISDHIIDWANPPENPYFTADAIPYIHADTAIVFPGNPTDLMRIKDIHSEEWQEAIFTALHETNHALLSADTDLLSKFPLVDGKIHFQVWMQRIETMATTFALDAGERNGLLTHKFVESYKRSQDGQYDDSMRMLYNAVDETNELRSNHPIEASTANTGIKGLKQSYERAFAAQDRNLSEADLLGLQDTNKAALSLNVWSFADEKDKQGRPTKLAQQANQIIAALPASARVTDETPIVDGAPYIPKPMGPIDPLKSAAQIWLADIPGNKDVITNTDAKDYLTTALSLYNQRAKDKGEAVIIDTATIQTIASHPEDKTWAQELLKGTDIVHALQRGMENIQHPSAKGTTQEAARSGVPSR